MFYEGYIISGQTLTYNYNINVSSGLTCIKEVTFRIECQGKINSWLNNKLTTTLFFCSFAIIDSKTFIEN